MKVMVMVEGSGADEASFRPTEAMFAAMATYNEALVRAGVMRDGDGLKPSSAGARVVFEGGRTTVEPGPFADAEDLIEGYWIWEVDSLEEAIDWAKRCPHDFDGDARQVLEIRPYATVDDFGDAYTPELREREQRMAEQLRAQRAAGEPS